MEADNDNEQEQEPGYERGKSSQKRTSKFRLLSIKDIFEMPEPEWLIEGLVKRGTFVELYGIDKGGKSFLGLDWAMCSAFGLDWMGRTVRPGAVVYVAAEGAEGLQFRIKAWLDANEIEMDLRELEEKVPIRFLTCSVDMLTKEEVEAFIADISKVFPNLGLLVLDTLARNFGAGDENK